MISKQLKNAASAVNHGGVIIYPTESVFGMGCNPQNETAVMRLLELKNRSVDKGLILIASHVEQILPYIKPKQPDDLANALKTWPGFYTWVFQKSEITPYWLSGKNDSIAVRVTSHETVVQLCQNLGHALVSTSANISGQPTYSTISEIKNVFADRINHYLDAPLGGSKNPSTITNAHTLEVYR